MNEIYAKTLNKFAEFKRDERGSQTLEWIGIAAVIVIMVGVISTAFSNDTSIGKKVLTKMKDLIDEIAGGSGG
ncbi:hypothetical protein [Lentibacillus salicampi]|uniref:Uncharacterized protein n=1 Tax=Lentibacillus salicampi TaxID=175306 RepID=A0A4Y9AB85_9BACI|nr:hypothetical protein [Lentibacillus salicampi]TFJ91634.1 hypothetical protein E4U82_16715 [Lentibacillus salicampi]